VVELIIYTPLGPMNDILKDFVDIFLNNIHIF